MRVLVTGGTGLIGKSAVDRLIARGHTVRLFSRDAEKDSAQWSAGVEVHEGSIGHDSDVRGAADGCDAVLHIVGVVEESPPEVTFENINVQGTRRMVDEAERAGVQRFVYVSSLGAEKGKSDYHRSKKAAEDIVRGFRGSWLICRPGNVYGPGDEVISLLLKMVRTLPAVPVIGGGDQPFQPIWAEDLGEALARAVERADLTAQALNLAGPERVTTNELLDRLEEITERSPLRVPVPDWLAETGTRAASLLGIDLPVNADQITMLEEENVIPAGAPNALIDVFGVVPTPLSKGLARLADSQPEQLPSEGTGKLHRQRYWADIRGSTVGPDGLFDLVRHHFEMLPPEPLLEVGAEPGTPSKLEEGATLTLAVPLRGTIQVRVVEVADHVVTCVTLEGHFLAGVIRFMVEDRGEVLRFEVRSYTRAADVVDQIGMATVGKPFQKLTWESVVEETVKRSGGEAVDGVQSESSTLDDADAEGVEHWIEDLVMKRRRETGPVPGEAAPR